MVKLIRYAMGTVVASMACVAGASTGALDTFSVFDTPGLERHVHGRQGRIDLSAGPVALGDASAFFGVDALSNNDTHYLSSGVIWQSEGHAVPLLSAGVLHTVARGARFGSQTLMRATARTDWAQDWVLPTLILGVDQLAGYDNANAALDSRASQLGFGDGFGAAQYRFSAFRTTPAYTPWGSDLKAGANGAELTPGYIFDSGIQLSHSLRIHDGAVATGAPYNIVDQWQLHGTRQRSVPGRTWRLTAQLGDADYSSGYETPLALDLELPTRRWRSWRINTRFGWYQGGIEAPHDMPVAGGMWSVAADRELYLGNLRSRSGPSFALGGSRYAQAFVGSRFGLALAFPDLLDKVALHVDYLTPGWGPGPDEDDVQFMLTITQNAGAALSQLGGLVSGWRD